MILEIIVIAIVMLILGIVLLINIAPQFGARSSGIRLSKMLNSINYNNGKFKNLVDTPLGAENSPMWKNALKFMKKDKSREPDKVLETIIFDGIEFMKLNNQITFSWFGHSTLLLNMYGKVILTDPVFSEKASPFSFMGVKRFPYSNQYDVKDLPDIDVVLISHDHYDHLDYKTIKRLDSKAKKFYVPLGVAAHLIRWGIQEEKIVELDWWENKQIDDELNFIATPGRHFSGRKGVDKDCTLWCSWVIESKGSKVFYCGDSGYGEHFKQIGEKFGPFELTLMECGQYNEGWPYIHMMPEQSVQAHIDLKGKTMIPIHWGKFNLSLHKWTEPIERARKEAERLNVQLESPTPGEIVNIKSMMDEKNINNGRAELSELIESK